MFKMVQISKAFHDELKKVKAETGIPLVRLLEKAWKKYKEELKNEWLFNG